MQEYRKFPAPIEDNRSRAFGCAPVPCSDPLLDQSAAEARIDKAAFGLSNCFPTFFVRYTVALSVTLKRPWKVNVYFEGLLPRPGGGLSLIFIRAVLLYWRAQSPSTERAPLPEHRLAYCLCIIAAIIFCKRLGY